MKVTTKPDEPHTGSINGSSAAVLAPIPPAPLVEPAKRRRPVGLLAAAVVLAIAGGLGAVWAVDQSGERTDVVGVARQVDWGEVITAQDLAVAHELPTWCGDGCGGPGAGAAARSRGEQVAAVGGAGAAAGGGDRLASAGPDPGHLGRCRCDRRLRGDLVGVGAPAGMGRG